MKKFYINLLIVAIGALFFVGCEKENSNTKVATLTPEKRAEMDAVLKAKGIAPLVPKTEESATTSERKAEQDKLLQEKAKQEIKVLLENKANDWIGTYEYFCIEKGLNYCNPDGCKVSDLNGPSFIIVKNRSDTGTLDTLTNLEKTDLYSYNTCWSHTSECNTEFNYFLKQDFSESVVFTDNNLSGQVIRINKSNKNYVEMEAVGAVGTNIKISYGKCFSYNEI